MKTSELKEKSAADLEKLLKEKRETLRKFRFDVTGGKTKNVKEGFNLKKDIARILTLLASKSKNYEPRG